MAERGGPSRLRATASMIVTRVRPSAVRTERVIVLFADLRGYTGMAERLPAARIVPLLEEFFRTLAAATETYGGKVFHMAGDGMMAGFGAGKSRSGAREALAAGHAMLQDFAPIAARWRDELSIEAGIGVGLHERLEPRLRRPGRLQHRRPHLLRHARRLRSRRPHRRC